MQNFFADRFANKVMVVTGSASGIGKDVALRAAKEGAKVVVVDLNEEGEAVAEQIRRENGDAIFVKADLSNENEVKEMIHKAVESYEKLDILINNAGIAFEPEPFHTLDVSKMERVMKINFDSMFYCSKYFIQQVLKQNSGASIVNTSSIAGIRGLPSVSPYVASKHAVNGITKNMAMDYATAGIRVNSVNPCATDSPLGLNGLKALDGAKEKAKAAGVDMSKLMIPGVKMGNLQGRVVGTAEQASTILYLASDEASHITGAIFQTDGGYSTY